MGGFCLITLNLKRLNTKELTIEMANRLQISGEEVNALFLALSNNIGDELCKGNLVSVSGFGVFEARRKKERIFVDPVSKERLMSPPKQILAFKMSAVLKEKLNQ